MNSNILPKAGVFIRYLQSFVYKLEKLFNELEFVMKVFLL